MQKIPIDEINVKLSRQLLDDDLSCKTDDDCAVAVLCWLMSKGGPSRSKDECLLIWRNAAELPDSDELKRYVAAQRRKPYDFCTPTGMLRLMELMCDAGWRIVIDAVKNGGIDISVYREPNVDDAIMSSCATVAELPARLGETALMALEAQ